MEKKKQEEREAEQKEEEVREEGQENTEDKEWTIFPRMFDPHQTLTAILYVIFSLQFYRIAYTQFQKLGPCLSKLYTQKQKPAFTKYKISYIFCKSKDYYISFKI